MADDAARGILVFVAIVTEDNMALPTAGNLETTAMVAARYVDIIFLLIAVLE